MPRFPRLAHKAPVFQARVGSLLSWKRTLLLGLAVYGFGTHKLINQEIFSFISNTCVVLVLCLRCQRCQIGLPQTTRQFAVKSISCEIILFIDFSLFFLSLSRILYSVWWPCYSGSKTLLLIWKLINRVVMNYFVGNWLEHQGHPTTVFCKIRVRGSKYCLEFFLLKVWHQTSDIMLKSDVWQQTPADIRWPFFMYNFQSFSNKSATTFWSLIFHILLPMQVRLFFAVKRKSKIFGKVILEPW